MPHNVEFKDSGGTSVYKGEIFPGVATKVYDVPAIPAGDVHVLLHGPSEHDGHRHPPVGRAATRGPRHAAPSDPHRPRHRGRHDRRGLVVRAPGRRARRGDRAGRPRGSSGRPWTASRSTCRPTRPAGHPQLLGSDLHPVPGRVPAAGREARRARRRRPGDRRRPDRRPRARWRATSWPSSGRRGRRSWIPTRPPSRRIASWAGRRRSSSMPRGSAVDPDRRGARHRLRDAVRRDRAVTAAAAAVVEVDGTGQALRRSDRGRRRLPDRGAGRGRGACSVRTAPARPRPSRSSRAIDAPTPARSGCSGEDPARGGRALRARVGLMLQAGGFDLRARPRETIEQYATVPCRPA